MSVGVLLITHPGVATALRNTARNMLGQCYLQTAILEVPLDAPVENITQQATDIVTQLDQGDGVLILSDIFGSTPCNIARSLHGKHHVRLVSGINIPMLVRVLNYVDLNLNDLARKAATGGRDGIVLCEENLDG